MEHSLRPRTASQSPLLPRFEEVVPGEASSPTLSSRRCWRLWLLRILLLTGVLYAALLVAWNSSRLGLTRPCQIQSDDVAADNVSTIQFVAADHSPAPGESDVLSSDPVVTTLPPQPPTAVNELSARDVSIRAAQAVARMQAKEEEQAKKTQAQQQGNKKLDARLRCRGWRATSSCDPDGSRLPDLDLPCSKPVPFAQSGYCELEDKDTGEVFHVMKLSCESVRADARFRCIDASDFVKFPVRAEEVAMKALAPGFTLPHVVPQVPGVNAEQSRGPDGIVMVIYPKLLASAYATVRTLREVLGCELPVELWFRPDEMRTVKKALEPLRQLADGTGGISFHEIDDPRALGYGSKVFAIYHSFFERVLFLDADNVPVRDPTYLFDSHEFTDTGAVFWPDFWLPMRTIFNLHSKSLVWQLIGVPFVDMFEQESGQLLIDRRRHAAPMEVLSFYAFHRPNHFESFKLVHGDKDLFRFAWMQQNASFHMIQTPPAVAGKVVDDNFCGMTMVQHDADGQVLFMHRNSHKLTGEQKREAVVNVKSMAVAKVREKLAAKKARDGVGRLTPTRDEVEAEIAAMPPAPTLEPLEIDGYPDAIIWTHLLSFNTSAPRADYYIETYNAHPQFPKEQHCYGQRHIGSNPSFYAEEIANLSFASLESDIRRFAQEGVALHEAALKARAN